MKEFKDYLERMIDGCDSLGGMSREKAIYQSVLKEYRKQTTSQQQTIERLRNALEQTIRLAKKANLLLNLENENHYIKSAEQLLKTTEPIETSKAKGE